MLSPEVIHFPGEYAYSFEYARERARLKTRIEGEATPISALARSFARSVLWQCSRKSSGLSKIGRAWVRWYRRAIGSVGGRSRPPIGGAAAGAGLRK